MAFFAEFVRGLLPFNENASGSPEPHTGYFELSNRPNYGRYVTDHEYPFQYPAAMSDQQYSNLPGVPPMMTRYMVSSPPACHGLPFHPTQVVHVYYPSPPSITIHNYHFHSNPPGHSSQPPLPPSSQPPLPPSPQPPLPPSPQPPQPSPPEPSPQPSLDSESSKSSLPSQHFEIQYVDPCIPENGKSHYTAKFHLMKRKENPQLVIRRGQEFHLKLRMDRQFDPHQDGMALVFLLAGLSGKQVPSIGDGTEVMVPLTLDTDAMPDGTSWSAQILDSTETTLTLKVIASSSCIVGEWKLEIDIKLQNGSEASTYLYCDSIYILFNPWCPHDQVYLESEEKLHEYIEEDITVIFRGVLNGKITTPWYLGQYEEHILDLCIVLFCIIHPVKPMFRNDAVNIIRHMTSALNSDEDDGVLEGRWGGDYEDGVEPTLWVGSMKILQTFYETQKSVKYGQCWVYAGLLTTVCRALGIPARPVTGYNVAHDSDGNLMLEVYYDENGKRLEGVDTTWNYHVWTEVWMKRPDLAPGDYDGWNIADATPLELSDHLFHCGPASVKAIRRGEVMKPYDGMFIYAGVNADVVHWRYLGEDKPRKLISSNTSWVGQDFSTKAIGSFERVDITNDYKHPEDSKEERAVMERALKMCNNMISRFYLNQSFKLIQFDSILPSPSMIGNACVFQLSMKSKVQKQELKVHARIEFIAEEYSGGSMELVKETYREYTVKPGAVTTATLEVKYDDYKNYFRDQGQFIVCFIADVVDTDFEYIYHENIQLKTPTINIEIEKTPRAGKTCTATASFINPLGTELTNGIFIFEGSGVTPGTALKLDQHVEAKAIAQTKLTWMLPEAGKGSISAVFNCDQMKDSRGYLEFTILDVHEHH